MMNRVQRSVLSENEIGENRMSKVVAAKGPIQPPVMRSKARVLTNVEVNSMQPNDVFSKPRRLCSLERQRSNADRLCKGYSVVQGADKENQQENIRQTQENLKGLSLKSDPAKEKRVERMKRQVTAPNANNNALFKLPNRPVKEKKPADKLSKAPSVSALHPLESALPPAPAADHSLIQICDDEDLKHVNDEFLLGLYAKDIFRFLRDLESRLTVRERYITDVHLMTDTMRSILVDWMYEVQDSFGLLQDTIQIAIALLDRFLQDQPKIGKDDLQLVGVACIFIAAKYEELYPPCAADFVHISANACTKQQILDMEIRITNALKFNLGRPPPVQFLRRYSRVAGISPLVYTYSKYFVDLAMVHYQFAHIAPSLLAASAILLAIFITSDTNYIEKVWSPRLIFYSEYSFEAIEPVARKLAKVISSASKLKFKTVQTMYKDVKRYGVSQRCSETTSLKLIKYLRGAD